jgi:DNA replication protein DnaC
MAGICIVCEGSGLRIVQEGGRQVARPCECRIERRTARMLERARIPKRYEHCTLVDFETEYSGADRSLKAARLIAQRFVEGYPVETEGKGLLLTGDIGVGKTHIAVGILKWLITERGVQGLYYDYRELLKQVNSYTQDVVATEMQVLRPVLDAEVLVLDELGASKPSEWVWDTVAQVLNFRYNELKTTIITTNFANELSLVPASQRSHKTDAKEANRDGTLGDRIGDRMLSRLQEMCVVVEMRGKDFRQTVARASFA